MEENPFTITEKVIPKYFCDREKESEQLIRLLTNRNNVVLFSPRRIGKTGLIQFCFEHKKIKKYYHTFYIDILSTTDLQEFVFLLGKKIYTQLQPFGEKVIKNFLFSLKSLAAKIGFDPTSGLPSLNIQLGDITQPEHTLEEIFSYLDKAGKPCLVAIDEFQQIAKYPEKGVEALLRSHILQINNCNFVFSGSERHLLGEMFLNTSRPFYQSSSMMELLPIPEDGYVEFILKMFEKGGRKIEEKLAREVYATYDGITFCIQRICNLIYSFTPPRGKAEKIMWEKAEDEIFFSYDTLFRERLSRLSPRQKELLFAISKEGKVGMITSTEFIKRNSLASASSVQSALRGLTDTDIVGKEDGEYLINDRFLSRWINKNYV